MRFSIFTLPLLLLAGTSVHAQGTVSFYNNLDTAIINGLTGAPVAAGPGFNVALFCAAAADGIPAEADFVPVGEAVTMGPRDGLFVGQNLRIPFSTSSSGAPYFQVRVWETAFGSTYTEAVAAPPLNGRPALRGLSPIFRLAATGNSGGFPPSLPVPLVENGLQGFTLTHPGLDVSPSLTISPAFQGPKLQVVLKWTADAAGQLEFTRDLHADSWTVATNEVLTTGAERSAVIDVMSRPAFYRLRRP